MPDIDFFDFHFHCAPDGGAQKVRDILESGEISGILCCTGLRTPHDRFESDNSDLLDLAAELGRDKLQLLAMAHIHEPDWKEHASAWFDKYPQITGIKLHPPTSGYTLTPDLIDPLFDFVLERDLFIASHTVPVPGLSAIGFFASLKKRRDTRLVIYHASTHEETAYLATSFRNVYVEPCWLGMFPNLFQQMRKHGGYEKMMGGTDGPGWFDSFEGSPYEDFVEIARRLLPDEESVKAFCAENSKRFLGID